jgi:site-specific DNA recombinase
MRIAIYARVSTQRQSQTQAIDQQIDRLRSHLSELGEQLADEDVFRDDGYSGATLRRPGLDRLRDKAALAAFDRIYVTDPDRLARNFVHQLLLIEELQKHGCHVEFLDRPMSKDPHDQLLLQIRGAVAEYERTLIAERTRRGRQHKYRQGQLLPWTRPPYGYRLAADKPRDPSGVRLEPAEAAVVKEMFIWFLRQGHGLLGLVKRLHEMGVPSPSGKEYWSGGSIRGILTNPSYTGCVYAYRTRYRESRVRRSATHPIGKPHGTAERLPESEWIAVGAIPAVVTKEQFDLVQAKLASNRSFARRNNKVTSYLLRAMVSCGHCQLACQARRVLPHNTYYICAGKYRQVRQRTGKRCDSRFIPAAAVDEVVWQDLCDLVRHPEVLEQGLRRAAGGHWLPQEWQARRDDLRRGQASITQQLERLTEAYLGGVIPLAEYQRRRADLGRRQQALGRQQEQLSREADRLDELSGLERSVESFCRRIASGLDNATFEQRRQLVELLIDRVVVTGDDVEIRYVIPTAESSEHVRFCHLRLDYFHHPADPDRLEPLLLARLHRHLDPVSHRLVFHPLVQPVVPVLVVGVDHRQSRELLRGQLPQHSRGVRAVVEVGRRHRHRQQQPQRVHHDMPLAALDLLVPVVPGRPADLARLDALRVDGGGARRRLPAGGRPDLLAQRIDDPLPGAVVLPGAEVVPDGALGEQVVR